ncbi:hypothetical protein [Bradyrhizobium ottawaense]|uniref:Uncharacterized protein n=1 Tax=Bradyrhizobium ottawaense TaxID=931866 RepID=A0ABY0QH12_9BRAD|nr:hypothetical protein [Bradyrhizobium ottawaense]SDK39015.1 hypothetical protein SAMN05444163_7999 [Bradyrhizobium ottawaense]SDK47010.1 hypothetical protein SAMN05444163_8192 [Bradyrhizobium ottawaense]
MSQKITNIIVMSAGPISFSAVRIEVEEHQPTLKFRMTFGDKVVAEMGEQAARLFSRLVGQTFTVEKNDEWTRLPTYAAVDADRKRIAARSSV